MTALFGVIAAIYGGSFLLAAGGGLLWIISPRFRRELVDRSQER